MDTPTRSHSRSPSLKLCQKQHRRAKKARRRPHRSHLHQTRNQSWEMLLRVDPIQILGFSILLSEKQCGSVRSFPMTSRSSASLGNSGTLRQKNSPVWEADSKYLHHSYLCPGGQLQCTREQDRVCQNSAVDPEEATKDSALLLPLSTLSESRRG